MNSLVLPMACAAVAALLLIPAASQAQTACYTAWSATAVYTGGMTASYSSVNYVANWWTQNQNPSTNNGGSGSGQPWTSRGACGTGTCTAVTAAPTALTASATTSTGTTLAWTAPSAPANCSITGYTVYKAGTALATVTGTSYTVTGLTASTAYKFTVAATDGAGTSAQSAAVTVTTLAATNCTTKPAAPTGLAASGTTSTSTTLNWTADTAPTNCTISSYTVYKGGTSIGTATGTSFAVSGLAASTSYSFTVAASDAAGASAQSTAVNVTTPAAGGGGGGTTTGTIGFHLLLGVSGYTTAEDSLTLTGGNYNDLIMSNYIAGVMYGHLIEEGFPGIQFDQDYLYGSVMGQLLQENLETEAYVSTSNLIDPTADQQAVMGVGQGGPYQINSYVDDMVAGAYTAEGHALVNFIAIQKNIGYTVAGNAAQGNAVTPASFNNKYYGPMLPAYFHYNDMVALNLIGKGTGGWVTPWEPEYDNTLANFDKLPNSFLDVILNVAYNQGYYGGLVTSYSLLGETATASTVATVNSYSSVWGLSSTYQQYPYQVRYYLDQFYDNPIPTTSATTTITPANHIAFSMSQLETVFTNVFELMDHSNGTAAAQYFTAAQAQTAFNAALTSNSVSASASLDLSNAAQRAQIFAVINSAITNLETATGMKFNATTTAQL
jgi:chitodextrinase